MGDEAATPPGLFDRIRTMIADEVGKLLRSGLLRNASISDGGLTIKGGFLRLRAPGATSDTLYVGALDPVTPDGTQQPGFVLYREDGTVAMRLWDNSPLAGYAQFLAIYDRAGNIILGDDTDSGQGIARPFIPSTFYRARYLDWVSTTSATFETMFRSKAPKQQPRMALRVWGFADTAGTTGELQILVNGTLWGTVQAVNNSVIQEFLIGPLAVAGTHMTELVVEIQARRTGGTGGIRVEPSRLFGQQS